MKMARSFAKEARKLAPDNAALIYLDSGLEYIDRDAATGSAARRTAYKLVGNSIFASARQQYAYCAALLDLASKLEPGDKGIRDMARNAHECLKKNNIENR